MTLGERQRKFAGLIGQLLVWIYEQGWEVSFGDFNRPDEFGHEKHSLHYIRLAADINLFVGGVFQDKDCPEWQAIGAHWLSMDPLCTWGGAFHTGSVGDLNHFSFGEGKALV